MNNRKNDGESYKLWEIMDRSGATGRISISYKDAEGHGWHITDHGFDTECEARQFMKKVFPNAIEDRRRKA